MRELPISVHISLPFLSFDMQGRITETTLLSGVRELWGESMFSLAGLVFLTATAGADEREEHLLLLLHVELELTPHLLEVAREALRARGLLPMDRCDLALHGEQARLEPFLVGSIGEKSLREFTDLDRHLVGRALLTAADASAPRWSRFLARHRYLDRSYFRLEVYVSVAGTALVIR